MLGSKVLVLGFGLERFLKMGANGFSNFSKFRSRFLFKIEVVLQRLWTFQGPIFQLRRPIFEGLCKVVKARSFSVAIFIINCRPPTRNWINLFSISVNFYRFCGFWNVIFRNLFTLKVGWKFILKLHSEAVFLAHNILKIKTWQMTWFFNYGVVFNTNL